jgi:hypothetical protein
VAYLPVVRAPAPFNEERRVYRAGRSQTDRHRSRRDAEELFLLHSRLLCFTLNVFPLRGAFELARCTMQYLHEHLSFYHGLTVSHRGVSSYRSQSDLLVGFRKASLSVFVLH